MKKTIGLIMLALLAGCATPKPQTTEEKVQASGADLQQTLKNTIHDAGRLQQMLALAEQAEADLKAGVAEMAALQKEQDQLNAAYDAKRDDFKKLGDRIQAVRESYRAKAIHTRQALAALATDEEWKKITSRELAIFGD